MIDIFVQDINSLVRTLTDVQKLQDRIGETMSLDFTDLHLAILKLQLDDCNNEIAEWLATAQEFRPPGGKAGKAWFKKFWAAFNQNSVKNVSAEIRRRRSEIGVALSVLGRYVDCHL